MNHPIQPQPNGVATARRHNSFPAVHLNLNEDSRHPIRHSSFYPRCARCLCAQICVPSVFICGSN